MTEEKTTLITGATGRQALGWMTRLGDWAGHAEERATPGTRSPRMTIPTLPGALASFAIITVMAAGCASTRPGETTVPDTAFNPTEQVQPATDLLRRYESALNRGDVEAIVSIYAPEAVFMAQHRTPAIGHAQIETAYREIFGTIRLDIAFEIDEVVVVSPTVAYARTRSGGTTTILANDAQVSEGNQELFVLVRSEPQGEWKIGRYIFSTTQPRS